MDGLRRMITGRVHELVGAGTNAIDLDRGDAGLFGPGSASWKVHGDFSSMMIGGTTALLLQMLHPAALAGIWDHSNFRADRFGRLRRTAQFIAGTTYGSVAQAETLIDRVRRIHDRVEGTLPDGTAYRANDPALLTWVHAAEANCFLRAYLRYCDPTFAPADQDRYYAEAAVVSARLGATDIPQNRREIDTYLRMVRPQLRCDARTAEVARLLLSGRSANLAMVPLERLVREAAIDLLPDWAAAMHDRQLAILRKPAVRAGALAVGSVLRWALRDNSASRARRRVAGAV